MNPVMYSWQYLVSVCGCIYAAEKPKENPHSSESQEPRSSDKAKYCSQPELGYRAPLVSVWMISPSPGQMCTDEIRQELKRQAREGHAGGEELAKESWFCEEKRLQHGEQAAALWAPNCKQSGTKVACSLAAVISMLFSSVCCLVAA